jgi:hypothetical protein
MDAPQSRKPRWGAGAEAAGLALGCLVLGYFTCRDKEPEVGRESRVFAATRSSSRGAEAGQTSQSRQAIEALLEQTLSGIATGKITEEKRVDLQRNLMRLLEQGGMGRPETRTNAAGMIVQQMFDRAKLQNVTRELGARQEQAISAMSRELTRQIALLAIGASPGADAIDTRLPPGVTKLDWKKIGGFQYVEGGELPADIRALGGRQVGLPGFMLTLGDSENIHEFILLESLWGCCFGTIPDLNQTIIVRLGSDHSMEYTAAPVLVTGKMEVGEERQGRFVSSLYRIVDATVTPLDAPN